MAEQEAQPLAQILEAGPTGLIALRGALAEPGVAAAVEAAVGLSVPQPRKVLQKGARAVAWMAPDELLLLLPPDALPDALAAARAALGDSFVTLADVSQGRVLLRICGPRADEVVMKLCPVDIARLPPDELRRTRAAQISVGLLRGSDAEIWLFCARSVAAYARTLLETAARPGGEVFPR